ncbi:MAG: hypothetical protein U0166_01180 [Acidobacteriota bacterium]
MTEVLGTLPAADLKVLVVWQPILEKDNRDAAGMNATVFEDPRMVHLWDGGNVQAKLWSPKLRLPKGQLAWDIFIVIPRGATWTGEDPPAPSYWSHQLEVPVGIKYNPAALRDAVKAALDDSGRAPSPSPAPQNPTPGPGSAKEPLK